MYDQWKICQYILCCPYWIAYVSCDLHSMTTRKIMISERQTYLIAADYYHSTGNITMFFWQHTTQMYFAIFSTGGRELQRFLNVNHFLSIFTFIISERRLHACVDRINHKCVLRCSFSLGYRVYVIGNRVEASCSIFVSICTILCYMYIDFCIEIVTLL